LKTTDVKISLGSVFIDRKEWELLKSNGYDREAIRNVIIGNGQDSLSDFVYDMLPEEEKAEHERGKSK
jgi:hypothetical protein